MVADNRQLRRTCQFAHEVASDKLHAAGCNPGDGLAIQIDDVVRGVPANEREATACGEHTLLPVGLVLCVDVGQERGVAAHGRFTLFTQSLDRDHSLFERSHEPKGQVVPVCDELIEKRIERRDGAFTTNSSVQFICCSYRVFHDADGLVLLEQFVCEGGVFLGQVSDVRLGGTHLVAHCCGQFRVCVPHRCPLLGHTG